MILLLILACGGNDHMKPPPDPTPKTEVAEFREALKKAGFTVQDGKVREVEVADCCNWESCYLFNPDNRYLTWEVPRAPGQEVANPGEDANQLAGVFRMREDEAFIAIGRTPPKARYFSYRTYLHDAYVPQTGERETKFGSFGDSLNHLVAKTGSDGPFDTDIIVASVANQTTRDAVRAAADEAGLGGMLNFDVIRGNVDFGLHNEADTIRMQHRISVFEDEAAGEAWVADPGFTILRVTPDTEAAPAPIEVPLRPHGTGTDESAWAAALEELDAAIIAAYPDWIPHRLGLVIAENDQIDCPTGCNRDTYMAISAHFLEPAQGDSFTIGFGVNHERTGKAVYSNVALYGAEHGVGIGSLHSGEMPGSAARYLPGHPQVDDLYTFKVDRTCNGEPYCQEIPTECPGFPVWELGAIAFRAYVEEATQNGPDPAELLIDRVIWFTRPPPSTDTAVTTDTSTP